MILIEIKTLTDMNEKERLRRVAGLKTMNNMKGKEKHIMGKGSR
jgi:hypothetical protein